MKREHLNKSQFHSKFKSFIDEALIDTSGNIAIIAGLVLLPALILVGGGTDIMRATTAASTLRSATETAALAAASYEDGAKINQVIDEYMNKNLLDSGLAKTLKIEKKIEFSAHLTKIELDASATINTFFLKLVNIPTLPVTASATAQLENSTIEISLVMDISSSMRGDKIKQLKPAAKSFVSQIFAGNNKGDVSFNLIPFGGTVNIDALFDQYAYKIKKNNLDPDKKKYNIGKSVITKDFRFSDSGACIEYLNSDFDDDVLPMYGRPQVPHFWYWVNFNPWCPEKDKGSAIFNSNDEKTLTDAIDSMELSDGTGSDIGAMWGYKSLSPKWRGKLGGDFKERPADYGKSTMKVMVIMGDGAISSQFRPKDPALKNGHTNRPKNNPTSLGISNRGNGKNRSTILGVGNATDPSTKDNGVGRFKRVCDAAKADGIVVYTIGFKITEGSLPDKLLEGCATDPGKYYLIQSLNIKSAFDAIAASVGKLRISG